MKKFHRTHFAYEPTLMFQRGPRWLFGREPVLRRMPNGDLISLVYSGGKHEPSPENLSLIVRSHDDGRTWSEPEIFFRHDSRCTWAPEIFTEGSKIFAVVHTYEYTGFFSEIRAFLSYTEDSGKTWSEPQTLAGIPNNFCTRQGKVLSDGSWIFPIYWIEQSATWNWSPTDSIKPHLRPGWIFRSGVIRSTNQGKTFSLSGYVAHETHTMWEPEVIELEPGHLHMLLRSDGTGKLWSSESRDFGLTWSAPRPTDIPNGGTKIILFKIDGAVVLVHNPTPTGRDRLELWVSRDGCRTWPVRLPLAENRNGAVPDVDPSQPWQVDAEVPPPWVCYPHGFADHDKRQLYLSCESVDMHYFFKVPFDDFLK